MFGKRALTPRTRQEPEMHMWTEDRPAFELLAGDRCDRCSARAAVVTIMQGGGSLLWCAHHYEENSAALTAGGAVIVRDDR